MNQLKIDQIIEIFNTLADDTRLKIILNLTNNELNVTQIHQKVNDNNNLTLSAISHQLKQLSNLKLVTSKKIGKNKFFKLSDNFCWCLIKSAQDHIQKKGCNKCQSIKEKN